MWSSGGYQQAPVTVVRVASRAMNWLGMWEQEMVMVMEQEVLSTLGVAAGDALRGSARLK